MEPKSRETHLLWLNGKGVVLSGMVISFFFSLNMLFVDVTTLGRNSTSEEKSCDTRVYIY